MSFLASQHPTALDPQWVKDSSDKAIAKCVAGEVYSRSDFKCITAARSEVAMSRCMAQAHEKGGP